MMRFLSVTASYPLIVTPVKTGVHPHPLNLDTVFQRYDGPFLRLKHVLSTAEGAREFNHFRE